VKIAFQDSGFCQSESDLSQNFGETTDHFESPTGSFSEHDERVLIDEVREEYNESKFYF
jgi:hypothetical protein